MGKKIKIGDIFELVTPNGLAYFQYTHFDKAFGHLIRILPGIYKSQPKDLDHLSESQEVFYIFFPLGAAANRGIVKFVANEAIPESVKKMPIMRRPGGRDAKGKVRNWWICDGDEEKLVNTLSDEQKRFSLKVIWNDTLLIERISSSWVPEKAV